MEQYQARGSDAAKWARAAMLFERILLAHDDFKNDVSLLETIQTTHIVSFYPKLHCKLNYIEYYFAELKRYSGENCKCTLLA